MTIQKAIRSGKPFKRRCDSALDWRSFPSKSSDTFTPEDILADDWIVKKKKITRKEAIQKARDKAFEEAAKLFENAWDHPLYSELPFLTAVERIADAIRSLGSKK